MCLSFLKLGGAHQLFVAQQGRAHPAMMLPCPGTSSVTLDALPPEMLECVLSHCGSHDLVAGVAPVANA